MRYERAKAGLQADSSRILRLGRPRVSDRGGAFVPKQSAYFCITSSTNCVNVGTLRLVEINQSNHFNLDLRQTQMVFPKHLYFHCAVSVFYYHPERGKLFPCRLTVSEPNTEYPNGDSCTNDNCWFNWFFGFPCDYAGGYPFSPHTQPWFNKLLLDKGTALAIWVINGGPPFVSDKPQIKARSPSSALLPFFWG